MSVSVVDLIQCTNEPNVSIPQLANLLIERTQHVSWVVVFKSLISLHHLMNYGNEVCCCCAAVFRSISSRKLVSRWDLLRQTQCDTVLTHSLVAVSTACLQITA